MSTKPLTIPALLAILLLVGCRGGDPAPDGQEQPELRTYEVPAGQADVLAEALNEVLAGSGEQAGVGRASSRLPGRLVVLAPGSVHDSVEEALAEMAGPADEGVRRPVTLRIWLVDVQPGQDQTPVFDESLGDAIEVIRKRFAGQGLRLVEEASLGLPSIHGLATLTTGTGNEISVRTLPGNVPTFDVELMSRGGGEQVPLEFRSRLELVPGETVIAATLNKGQWDKGGTRLVLMRLEAPGP